MLNKISNYFKKLPWRDIFLVVVLLIFEVSIHPLGFGPDRRIHDPAVYRLADSTYLAGDWYTQMAVDSGVYTFYAKLVNVWHFFPIQEETWRLLLYVVSLVVLYYAMIHIAKLLSESTFVVPFVAIFHAIVVIVAPPIWLYGPFIQVDGGLAPRSIGIALSFLALYFLLTNSRILPWVLLGVATLIHVSNSLIVFTLFLAAWLYSEWVSNRRLNWDYWFAFGKKAGFAVMVYIITGGWFALYVVSLGSNGSSHFSTAKFIWTWIYFRAPYMALPLIPRIAWILFFLHILAIVAGWYWLRKRGRSDHKKVVDLLGFVGIGAVFYFFLFYFFAFVWPWLPGFQFYSIRVVYLAHFVAYTFASLLLLSFYRDWLAKRLFGSSVCAWQQRVAILSFIVTISFVFFFFLPAKEFMKQTSKNLYISWTRVFDANSRVMIVGIPGPATEKYLFLHPEPFLAPPNWYGSSYYLPSVATLKSFGFTPKGSEEWFNRLNDMSRGELERIYEVQLKSGIFKPVSIDWIKIYPRLTTDEILSLSKKYDFKLFLTYQNLSYPFPIIVEDSDYRLYRIPE